MIATSEAMKGNSSKGTQMGRKSIEMFETEALKTLHATFEGVGVKRVNKEINPGWLGAMFISWVWPVIQLGKAGELKVEDLPQFCRRDRAASLELQFKPYWKQVEVYLNDPIKSGKPSLPLFLLSIIYQEVLFGTLWNAAVFAANVVYPLCLQHMITFLDDPSQPTQVGALYAGGLIVAATIKVLGANMRDIFLRSTTLKLQSVLSSAVARKRFSLSPKAQMMISEEQVITLVDQYIGMVTTLLEGIYGFTAIIYVSLDLLVLYYLVGISALIGAVFIVILIVLMSYLSRMIEVHGSLYTVYSVQKVKVFREFLKNSTVVKYLGLDFTEKYMVARDGEVQENTKMFHMVSLYNIFGPNFACIASIVVFGVFGLTGSILTTSVIFPALLLLDIGEPILQINSITEVFTSVRIGTLAISEYLLAEESPKENQKNICCNSVTLILRTPTWSYEGSVENPSQFKLKLPKMNLPSSGFIGVFGEVGSGKSTFLKGLLGLVPQVSPSGGVRFQGKYSYAPQTPFIFSGSVKDNITMFAEFIDHERLSAVVKCCALGRDLSLLPDGVFSMLGEGGVNLSGGQKARVSLARALYHEADAYLLDDPLSSCDPKVSRHIFASMKLFLKGKRVLLATHSLQHLSEMDYIIALSDSTVSQYGSFDEVLSQIGGQFSDFMAEFKAQAAFELEVLGEETTVLTDDKLMPSDCRNSTSPVTLIMSQEEDQAITWSTYKDYLLDYGIPATAIVVFAWTLNTVLTSAYFFCLSYLTEIDSIDISLVHVYIALALTSSIASGLSYYVILIGSKPVSSRRSDQAVKAIFNAKSSFLQANTIGRIVNRLSTNVRNSERGVPVFASLLFSTSSALATQIILIAWSSPLLIILMFLIGYLGYSIFQYYLEASVKLQRLSSVSSSKLSTSLNELLVGADVFIVFGIQDEILTRYQLALDEYLSISYIVASSSIWFNQRLSGSTLSLTIAISIASIFGRGGSISSGAMGLVLVNTGMLGGALEAVLGYGAKLSNKMNDYQRLRYYALQIPQEAVKFLPSDPAKEDWPSKGKIEFQELVMAYDSRPEVNVIKGFNASIKAGEKIGVVGRTGAGKSTLISALFRMIEAKSGSVFIDGLDISQLGLNTLRKRISMIPQAPVLFEGTVRSNLDDCSRDVGWEEEKKRAGVGEYTDMELWTALDLAGLKEYILTLEGQLDAKVTSEGSNFSHGQRQLMCLARAIISKPKILVMDEATASIDAAADERIQSLIKTYFKETTVISIAHRVASVSDYDRIMVLLDGKLTEFGSPSELLLNPVSEYSQLVAASSSSST